MVDLYLKLLLLFLSNCGATINTKYIYSYEYGSIVPHQHLSYYHSGEIPALVPVFAHIINQEEMNPEFEKNITYLKVEYRSPLSNVHVVFEPDTYTLKFAIEVPLVRIEFAVATYGLKKKSGRRNKVAAFYLIA